MARHRTRVCRDGCSNPRFRGGNSKFKRIPILGNTGPGQTPLRRTVTGPTAPSWSQFLPLSRRGADTRSRGGRSQCGGCQHAPVQVAQGHRVHPARASGESGSRHQLPPWLSSQASIQAEADSSMRLLVGPPCLGCPAGRGAFWKNINLLSSCKTHMRELASRRSHLERRIEQQEDASGRCVGGNAESCGASHALTSLVGSTGGLARLPPSSFPVSLPLSSSSTGRSVFSSAFRLSAAASGLPGGEGPSLPPSEPRRTPAAGPSHPASRLLWETRFYWHTATLVPLAPSWLPSCDSGLEAVAETESPTEPRVFIFRAAFCREPLPSPCVW